MDAQLKPNTWSNQMTPFLPNSKAFHSKIVSFLYTWNHEKILDILLVGFSDDTWKYSISMRCFGFMPELFCVVATCINSKNRREIVHSNSQKELIKPFNGHKGLLTEWIS